LGQLTPTPDDNDNKDLNGTAALRVKAAHCTSLAGAIGEETRARPIRIATEFLGRAAQLERHKK